jgi:hypothetical protein
MISQKCPKCGSSRIRRGYKPTPVALRLVGIHHLLCNHCNLLFTGFAVPGTIGKSGRRSAHRGRNKQDQPTVGGFSRLKDFK